MNNLKMLPTMLVFAEVAQRQSFTLAAKHFGMSKSAVSQQIKRLELHLGQQLLSRHTRGMSLTATGEKLLAHCDMLGDQVELAFEVLNQSKEMPSGPFALTIPHSCEKDIVIPALNQLCIEYPDIEPSIMVTDEAMDLIQDKLDVAIYGGKLKDSNYRSLPIGTGGEIFCATPAYVNKNSQLDTPEQMQNHRWIAAPWQSTPLPLYRNRALSDTLLADIRPSARANTLPSVQAMVANHMGFALLPEIVVRSALAAGQLVRVLPNYQGSMWPFHFVHRFHGEKPIHISRFYQLVKQNFARAV